MILRKKCIYVLGDRARNRLVGTRVGEAWAVQKIPLQIHLALKKLPLEQTQQPKNPPRSPGPCALHLRGNSPSKPLSKKNHGPRQPTRQSAREDAEVDGFAGTCTTLPNPVILLPVLETSAYAYVFFYVERQKQRLGQRTAESERGRGGDYAGEAGGW